MFLEQLRTRLGMPSDAVPGFLRYEAVYRQAFRDRLVVDDIDNIPPERVFTYSVPCGMAHPHVCATKHAADYAAIRKAAKHVRYYAESKATASYHTFCCEFSDGSMELFHCTLGTYRGANPKVSVLIQCTCVGNFCTKNVKHGEWVHCMDISVCGFFFGQARRSGLTVAELSFCPRMKDPDRASLSSEGVYLLDAKMSEKVTVFPRFEMKKATNAALTRLRKGLAACKPKAAARAARPHGGVRLVMPRVRPLAPDDPIPDDDIYEDDDMDAESAPEDGDSSEDDPEVRAPRQRNLGVPWGPFSLAPVFSSVRQPDGSVMKIQKGWGANCLIHEDVPCTGTCKKNLSGTCDLTRRMAAHWLLLGHDVGGSTAKTQHVAVNPRQYDTPSWDELVATRVALFGS